METAFKAENMKIKIRCSAQILRTKFCIVTYSSCKAWCSGLPTLFPCHVPANFSITTSSLNTFPVFLCLKASCVFVFLHIAPAHLTIHLNLHCFFSLIVSLFSAWLHDNSFTLSVLCIISPPHFQCICNIVIKCFYHNITVYNTVLSSLQMFSHKRVQTRKHVIRDWKCWGEIMLLVMDALLVGKSGQGTTPREWRSYHVIMRKIRIRLMKKNNVDWGGLWGVRVQCEEKQTRKTP